MKYAAGHVLRRRYHGRRRERPDKGSRLVEVMILAETEVELNEACRRKIKVVGIERLFVLVMRCTGCYVLEGMLKIVGREEVVEEVEICMWKWGVRRGGEEEEGAWFF